ncbi:uncharacterized protein P174DRAFT_222841 [Aspergillus novofumigatus IBT 16806]|uniref:Uncharacterized protein n=1 Tax=Aspergillus novofumigatus (strain IBT 16806) TaxID=1392255 RepID=A0A2I1C6C0_ASPN1|nr:uncharacterized protein P174DRAFT_222841 [Aspergillus novofumigatus IBT 16806]PKX93146.1 hypothetical protein P174DRAFT_222841 [Aspergillus novofumigatus IBT 16806]
MIIASFLHCYACPWTQITGSLTPSPPSSAETGTDGAPAAHNMAIQPTAMRARTSSMGRICQTIGNPVFVSFHTTAFRRNNNTYHILIDTSSDRQYLFTALTMYGDTVESSYRIILSILLFLAQKGVNRAETSMYANLIAQVSIDQVRGGEFMRPNPWVPIRPHTKQGMILLVGQSSNGYCNGQPHCFLYCSIAARCSIVAGMSTAILIESLK